MTADQGNYRKDANKKGNKKQEGKKEEIAIGKEEKEGKKEEGIGKEE